eukprot:TRINITY_DN25012_c0_g1_i1.p1 TRINITY_DN25012_c0_g1~~TRINITY_DN25012_c0_g1_i1.p1  ORF type:complete len:759 (+),score=307.98 TRINITY_DN25012_c0_g1_i1:78-2354(+)
MSKSAGEPLEKVVELLYAAESLLVIVGPDFTDGGNPTNSELCTPQLLSKPDRFMGFWGEVMNRFQDRTPHEGFQSVKRWADNFFHARQEDIRKRQKKKKAEDDEEGAKPALHRCFVVTGNIDGYLQRVGFEAEQLLELVGNINEWQCSTPCKLDSWFVDRAFRFEIDPTTGEAHPVKYVIDAGLDAPRADYEVVDDEENVVPADIVGAQTVPSKGLVSVKKALMKATPIRIEPELQLPPPADLDPDNFMLPYPKVENEVLQPYTFPPVVSETVADSPPSVAEAPPGGGDDGEKAKEAAKETFMVQPYLPLEKVFHRAQHVRVLQDGLAYHEGGFTNSVDPVKALEARKVHWGNIQGFFNHEDPKNVPYVRTRMKYIWYNISVFVIDDKDAASDLETDGLNWSQGGQGRYFFSNVKAASTFQEPPRSTTKAGRFIDVVRVPFPAPGDVAHVPVTSERGRQESLDATTKPVYNGYRNTLPPTCRISTVIEVLIGPKEPPKPQKGTGDLPAVPHPFRRIVHHLTGRLDLRGVAPETGAAADKVVEHVLETSGEHLHQVKVGVHAGAPAEVKYLEWEVGCEDDLAPHTLDASTVRRCIPDAAGQTAYIAAATKKRGDTKKPRVTRPTTNHQLCVHCHNIARPRIQMAAKDPTLVPFARKTYQAWEKATLEGMKASDANRMLVLELGCTKKMDAVRKHSETCWKKVKNSGRASFVRIAHEDLETKKAGGEGGGDQYVTIQGDPKEMLRKLDRLLSEKLRKKNM